MKRKPNRLFRARRVPQTDAVVIGPRGELVSGNWCPGNWCQFNSRVEN